MSLRYRNRPSSSSSSSSPPPTPGPSPPGTEQKPQLEWYRYALNLFLAQTLRFLGKFGFWIHNNRYHPRGISASRQVRVRVRDGYQVLLNIYEPTSSSSSFPSSSPTPTSTTSSNATKGRPCVINFHGGGFTIGSSTDDSRFAHWCIRTSVGTSISSGTSPNPNPGLGAIFISVEYRLSPEYPYPAPVNDCIDATKYILSHPREFGIDSTKVFLSGFSAGGSLAVTTALALSSSSSSSSSRLDSSFNPMKTISDTAIETNTESRTRTSTSTSTNTDWGSTPSTKHPILGVIPFYPVLDFHTPRAQKLINSPSAKPLPGWMTRMFDTSYLPPLPLWIDGIQ